MCHLRNYTIHFDEIWYDGSTLKDVGRI